MDAGNSYEIYKIAVMNFLQIWAGELWACAARVSNLPLWCLLQGRYFLIRSYFVVVRYHSGGLV
jgi:hypothetical protein